MSRKPDRPRPLRIRRRLTVAFILVAALSAAVLSVGSYLLIQRSWLEESQQRAGEDTMRQLALAEQFLPDPDRLDSLRDAFARSGRDVVIVADGAQQVSNPAIAPDPPPRLRAAVASGQLAYQRLDHEGRPVLMVGGRIGGSPDELYVIVPEQRIHDDLAQLRTVLAAGALVVTLLAAGVGYSLARRTLEPVSRASAAARAVAEGLLDTRLPVESRDEFGAWAASFNRMAAALEAKIAALWRAQQRERQFTADVAHELRTPVTALVAEASLLREHLGRLPAETRRPAELLVDDVLRLRRLVDELLEISRLDAGREPVRPQPVDLAALARAVVEAGGWRDRVRVADLDRAEGAVVATDPRRVERVVANLVANAVQHGGRTVVVSVAADGPVARVEVLDDGPGIAPEHLPRLFDRFFKADPSRAAGGSGLGLAIARENARLLGGDIEVDSAPGAGSRFRFTLPVTRLLPDGEAAVGDGADAAVETSREGGLS